MAKWLTLEQIGAYRTASTVSEQVWKLVATWDWLEKQAIGVQLIKSTDSIGANIAEGFGRFHKKDKQKFYFNARGSTYESVYWIVKARNRNIISRQTGNEILTKLKDLPKEINALIRYTEKKLTI